MLRSRTCIRHAGFGDASLPRSRAAARPLPRLRRHRHESGFGQTLSAKVGCRRAAREGSSYRSRRCHVLTGSATGTRRSCRRIYHEFVRGTEPMVEGKASRSDSGNRQERQAARTRAYIGWRGTRWWRGTTAPCSCICITVERCRWRRKWLSTMREPGDSVTGRLGMRIRTWIFHIAAPAMPADGVISFPYAFPQTGKLLRRVQVNTPVESLPERFP